MTCEKIKNRIEQCATLFGFEYNGKEGNIDPYYIPKTKSNEYLLFFDGTETIVKTIDEVMNTPFVDGKSIKDIYDQIIITEW